MYKGWVILSNMGHKCNICKKKMADCLQLIYFTNSTFRYGVDRVNMERQILPGKRLQAEIIRIPTGNR